VLRRVAVHCSVCEKDILECVGSALECVGSALECVGVCWSMLQYV